MANYSASGENLSNIEEINDDSKPRSRFKVEQVDELTSEDRKNSWAEKPLSYAARKVSINVINVQIFHVTYGNKITSK